MTSTTEFTPNADLMRDLAADAEYFRPRMFAVYGVSRGVADLLPPTPFLGWGIEFGDGEAALFLDPRDGSVHRAQSAEQILLARQRMGEARLTWFD